LTYQWQKNGVSIEGATTDAYDSAAAASGDSGATVRCLVSGPTGTTTSKDAVLTVTAAPAPFAQDSGDDGIVSMEAENYTHIVSQGGHSWIPTKDPAGFTGSSAMLADPADGASVKSPKHASSCPRMDFSINFVKSGVHYVWVRGLASSKVDNSYHVNIDGDYGTGAVSAEKMSGFNNPAFGAYVWDNQKGVDNQPSIPGVITVKSPGLHVLHVSMRSAGLRIDKILLTTNPKYVPAGNGPAETLGDRPKK